MRAKHGDNYAWLLAEVLTYRSQSIAGYSGVLGGTLGKVSVRIITMTYTNVDQVTANTAAGLALDAVEAAGHGHPGTAVALAPVAQLLFAHHLKHNPSNPDWSGRDRFVLSCGHASMLLYAQLHLSGYQLSLDDLKNFRKAESLTPGHPEYGHTVGVEMTTGPLGQGIATAVGMAWAQLSLADRFDPNYENSPLKSYVYVVASDGDLSEGISSEASSFAGLHKISNLIVIYDDNEISIDGNAKASFNEDIVSRYRAYGWHAVGVNQTSDGKIDIQKLDQELVAARKSDRPTLIALRTSIAYPSPSMTGMAATHGSPMGTAEVAATKLALGLNPDEFFQVPALAMENKRQVMNRGAELQQSYDQEILAYQNRQPSLAKQFHQLGNLDISSLSIPVFPLDTQIATRKASQQVLEELAELPQLVGGSADLSESNGVAIKSLPIYHGVNSEFGDLAGRRLLFGVREHAMAAFCNGIALSSPLRPFAATFLIFSDYMKPSIRLAALMNLPVTFVFSHDSIGLGEDGPTHQPVEQLWSLRATPGLSIVRPADANETAAAWVEILNRNQPAAIILSRQNLPVITENPSVRNGAYVLYEPKKSPQVILIATGSEVQLAVNAARELESNGLYARVVSAPCLEWFDEQPREYRDAILAGAPKIAIEAGSPVGWYKYVGSDGVVLGVNNYGASATPKYLFEKFGLTTENTVQIAKQLLD